MGSIAPSKPQAGRVMAELIFLLLVFMLGFAGFPFTGGMIGKFYVFSAAYEAGWWWLHPGEGGSVRCGPEALR